MNKNLDSVMITAFAIVLLVGALCLTPLVIFYDKIIDSSMRCIKKQEQEEITE